MMILQALNRYYEILLQDTHTNIAPFGYSTVGVSFALNISAQGDLLDVLPQFTHVQRSLKMVEVPRSMIVPEQVKRSGTKPKPNFLCDNSAFVLGLSDKDDIDPEYAKKRFEVFHQLHKDLLLGLDCKPASALLAFLDNYNPHSGREHPAINIHLETLLRGGKLVFLFDGVFVHEDPDICKVWEFLRAGQHTDLMQCLVTGEKTPVARLHPSLKRIRGARPTGLSLVSFNKPAYESYNRTDRQGLNSPVSQKAAFAYSTALNYLLSDANPNKKFYLSDTTVVYWAESDNRAYETTFASIFDPEYIQEERSVQQGGRIRAEAALKVTTDKVRRAQMLDLEALLADLEDENPRFYILGLAPNAARVSVRFFITDPFEKIIGTIMSHYRDLKIVKEFDYQPDYLTIRQVLDETVSKKSSDKNAAPLLAGAVFRAILTNSPYPAGLYYAIINRIRADMDDSQKGIYKINYARAAIIKAFLTRKYRHQPRHPFKEVLTMSLNEQSTYPPYVLGRLFAVLEKAQKDANPNLNTTIKDNYFTSACASPRIVFPTLLRLSQHHIAKAKYGYANDRRIQDLLNLLDLEENPIPARLTLDEQGTFVLGYYHQRADFFAPKTDAKETKP